MNRVFSLPYYSSVIIKKILNLKQIVCPVVNILIESKRRTIINETGNVNFPLLLLIQSQFAFYCVID